VSEIEAIAARYRRALADIVNVLGPENICSCEQPPDCGLVYEAEEALRTAKEALGWRDTS
jgi:hypothetical protein